MNYSMYNFQYDETAEDKLKMLISYLKSFGLNVSLVLTPYHPDLYELMKEEKPLILEIEKKFIKFAQKNKINVIGSYDASLFKCQGDEFYDGMHPKISCMKKIFSVFSYYNKLN